MKFVIKHPQKCSRKELDMFHSLLSKLHIKKSHYFIKRITRCIYLARCINDNTMIGISAIKHPQYTWIKYIEQTLGISLPKDIREYGYVYILPTYRGQGIAKKLYDLLFKHISFPLFAITGIDNLPMQLLLKEFGFKRRGTFKSNIDTTTTMCFYLK